MMLSCVHSISSNQKTWGNMETRARCFGRFITAMGENAKCSCDPDYVGGIRPVPVSSRFCLNVDLHSLVRLVLERENIY